MFGTSLEEGRKILAAMGEAPDDTLALPEALRDAVRLFDAVATQWRVAGMDGVALGLDYSALDIAARWLGIAPTPRLLSDIAVMEDEGLTVFRERRR